MASTKCLACQEEITGGQFISIPAGAIHPECFLCPCCGKSLVNAKGYLPYKVRWLSASARGSPWHDTQALCRAYPRPVTGTAPSGDGHQGNFVCSVNCRALAVRDPSLLLQTAKHWRLVQGANGQTAWDKS